MVAHRHEDVTSSFTPLKGATSTCSYGYTSSEDVTSSYIPLEDVTRSYTSLEDVRSSCTSSQRRCGKFHNVRRRHK